MHAGADAHAVSHAIRDRCLGWRAVHWKSPPRDDNETGWKHAFARHGAHTLVGMLWAAIVVVAQSFLPVVADAGRRRADPLDPNLRFTSRIGIGRKLRRRKYFLLPEESHPPPVIRATRRYWHHAPHPADVAAAVVDPVTNALICAQAVGQRAPARPRLVDTGARRARAAPWPRRAFRLAKRTS